MKFNDQIRLAHFNFILEIRIECCMFYVTHKKAIQLYVLINKQIPYKREIALLTYKSQFYYHTICM